MTAQLWCWALSLTVDACVNPIISNCRREPGKWVGAELVSFWWALDCRTAGLKKPLDCVWYSEVTRSIIFSTQREIRPDCCFWPGCNSFVPFSLSSLVLLLCSHNGWMDGWRWFHLIFLFVTLRQIANVTTNWAIRIKVELYWLAVYLEIGPFIPARKATVWSASSSVCAKQTDLGRPLNHLVTKWVSNLNYQNDGQHPAFIFKWVVSHIHTVNWYICRTADDFSWETMPKL